MSLARLLLEERGVRNKFHAPKLTVRKIVGWARNHHARTGKWPTQLSGPIPEAPGETWLGVQSALRSGFRGVGTSGMTLRQLLADNFGVRHYWRLPSLKPRQIVAWAAAHHRRTGKWPTKGVRTDCRGARRDLERGSIPHWCQDFADCPAVPVCSDCCHATIRCAGISTSRR